MLHDFKIAMIFLTRVPIRVEGELSMRDLARAAHLFPVIGVLIGGSGALALTIALWLELPSVIGIIFAITTMIVLTGALHEDGLADMVDGFGAGADREHALEIMHDSRIGTYGVIAILLSFSMRFVALTSLLEISTVLVAIIAAAAVSRAAAAMAMAFQPPARTSGLAAVAGNPPREKAGIAVLVGVIVALVLIPTGSAITALVAAALMAAGAVVFIQHWLGGATGDTLGAVQQITEMTFLIALIPSLGQQSG